MLFSRSRRRVCAVCGRKLEDGDRTFCQRCLEMLNQRCREMQNQHCSEMQRLYPDTDSRGRKGRWEKDLFHCPKCQKRYSEKEDQYCRYCGAKRENKEGKYFVLSPDFIECVYGPMPGVVKYDCPSCGYHWEGSNWDRQTYCPKCGTRAKNNTDEGLFR